jgi:hypothetical protein
VPPLNLNTNTVTFTIWIYPKSSVLAPSIGLFMNRNGGDAAGIGFGTTINGAGTPCLAYTWNNNSSATYGWNSGLFPVANVWNFVTCVITPSNTTMYLYYATGGATNLYKAVHNMTNAAEAFTGGTTWLGSDNWQNGRTFYGCIDEVAVFTNSLGENQIVDLFLKALGLLYPMPPVFYLQPTNTMLFIGQTLQLTAIAYPFPNYQWQTTNNSGVWANVAPIPPGRMPTNSTLIWSNYTGPYSTFRCIATNYGGKATSSMAYVTLLPVANWNKGLWTVNFAIAPGGFPPVPPYVGRGVLGTNTYWNALSGSQFANTPPSLRDDGVTVSGIHFGSTNSFWPQPWSSGTNNVLLDTFCTFGTNGTAFVFTSVPNGKYNLALYGLDGADADRSTIFTVNGVSQSVTNAQDAVFLPDNTVIFTNVLVSNGRLEVDMMPVPSVPLHPPNTEGDFNGAQLELLLYAPQLIGPEPGSTNGLFTLTWVGGGLLEATNISGPWVTNTATSPYTVTPTGAQRFFRIVNYHFP